MLWKLTLPRNDRNEYSKYLLHRITTLILAAWTLYPTICSVNTVFSAEKTSVPNIVLILADDMGYGDPQCYNSQSKCVTPNIDRLAKEGMRFTDAHAAGGVCHPSRYGLLTGRYPFRHHRDWRKEPLISAEEDTVPKLLVRAGYQTRMIGKWHLGFEDGYDYDFAAGLQGGPVDRGFQSYFGMPASLDIPPYYYIENKMASPPPTIPIDASSSPGWSPIQGAFWREGLRAGNFIMEDVLDVFATKAIETIQQDFNATEKPQFLYLALPAPHTPWLPADKFRGLGEAGLYSEFVAHVDDVVGRVLNAIDKTNSAKNTLVIFSSDNGPTWYDVDEERYHHNSAGPFRGMKGDAWEGGHRVPFIMRWPNQIPAWSECDETIGFIDLLPTVSEMTGVASDHSSALDGRSFAQLIEMPTDSPWPRGERVMLQHHSGNVIRSGQWKLITNLGSSGFTKPSKVAPVSGGPKGQLYDLGYDKGEQDNLWLEHPEIVEKLSAMRKEILNKE